MVDIGLTRSVVLSRAIEVANILRVHLLAGRGDRCVSIRLEVPEPLLEGPNVVRTKALGMDELEPTQARMLNDDLGRRQLCAWVDLLAKEMGEAKQLE